MSEVAAVPPIVNRMMKFILRSPAHGMVSKSVLLITFIGRKSGKRYTTPVSYSLSGDQVYIFTHASWWKNLRNSVPVTLKLQGKEVQGWPETVSEDKAVIATALAAHLKKVPSDARYYQVTFDQEGNPNIAQVEKAVRTVVMVRIQLC